MPLSGVSKCCFSACTAAGSTARAWGSHTGQRQPLASAACNPQPCGAAGPGHSCSVVLPAAPKCQGAPGFTTECTQYPAPARPVPGCALCAQRLLTASSQSCAMLAGVESPCLGPGSHQDSAGPVGTLLAFFLRPSCRPELYSRKQSLSHGAQVCPRRLRVQVGRHEEGHPSEGSPGTPVSLTHPQWPIRNGGDNRRQGRGPQLLGRYLSQCEVSHGV